MDVGLSRTIVAELPARRGYIYRVTTGAGMIWIEQSLDTGTSLISLEQMSLPDNPRTRDFLRRAGERLCSPDAPDRRRTPAWTLWLPGVVAALLVLIGLVVHAFRANP